MKHFIAFCLLVSSPVAIILLICNAFTGGFESAWDDLTDYIEDCIK